MGRVGVIRIGAPATRSIEPGLDWPEDLRSSVIAGSRIIRGGHEYTGEVIVDLDLEELKRSIRLFREAGVDAIAVSSVFSMVNPEHENIAREMAMKEAPGIPVVLSHEIGSIGLLERECHHT